MTSPPMETSPGGFLLIATAALISWAAISGEYLWKEIRPRIRSAAPDERDWTMRRVFQLALHMALIVPPQLVMVLAILEPQRAGGAFGRIVAILELAAAGLWLLLGVVYIRADARKSSGRGG